MKRVRRVIAAGLIVAGVLLASHSREVLELESAARAILPFCALLVDMTIAATLLLV